MEESHRKVLIKLRLKISRIINVRRITEVLFSRGILGENDRKEILAETTTQYKALHLLDLLPRGGSEAFQVFLEALYGSGAVTLANAIQSELSGEEVAGEEVAGEGNEWRPRSVGLPRKVPKFVGRMDVCEEIAHSLATEGDDMTSLVTIVAPPGFGKTAVATNIGYRMLDQGKDVLYISLRKVPSLNLAAEHMLKKLVGINFDAVENPVLQLTSYLTSLQHQTVLILDNAEDLQIGDGPNFEDFLEKIGQHALNVVTLITSRNAISKLELFPFSTKNIPLKPLTDEDSSAYLKNHVPDIADQCARKFATACRGVPLLLTITGSFLRKKAIDPIDLHRKLQNCPHSFLKAKDAKIQELYSLLRVFYNNLGPEMKEALAYLASFPTSFTKEEAKDVLFPNEDYLNFQLVLDDLEQHSLVQQDEDQNNRCYSLHPLVQAFCKSSREDTCTGYNTAIRLFSYHYLSLLQRLSDDFISTDCKIIIDKYHISKTNISHALLASTEDDDLKHYGLSVSTEAVNFLGKVLNLDEFMSLYSQCLRVAEKMTDKTLYSECLVSIGFKQLCYYGYKDAYRTDAKRSLQEAHDLQAHLVNYDSECKAHCKCKLGLCCFVAGDRKKGISLIAQGIGMRKRLVRSLGSGKLERVLLAGGFCDLAMAMFTGGEYRAAVNIWRNLCLVRYRELLGTHPFTASLLRHIGDAYQKLGDPRRAVAFKKESLVMQKFLSVKHGRPTDDELEGLGDQIGEKWEKLGRLLGVRHQKLQEINRAHDQLYEKGHYMLKHWKRKEGSAATYEAVSDALTHELVWRPDLAEKFCQALPSGIWILAQDLWEGALGEYSDSDKDYEEDHWYHLFDIADRDSPPLHLTLGKCLGAGNFGEVYKFRERHRGILVVKIVKMEPQYTEKQEDVKALNNEISILKSLKHERIVSYHGSQQVDGHLHLFMDFMPGGSLSDHIKKYGVLSESKSQRFTQQMLEGICFLHSEGIIHRDIKGSNVLLDGEGNVKLADFGVSKMIQKVGSKTDLVSHCGTPHWMAPEIFRGEGYGRKADIWSLGCTVVEMLTGKPPLGHLEPAVAIFRIGSKPTEPTLPESVSQDAKEFIKAALTWKPNERPSSDELQCYTFVLNSTEDQQRRFQIKFIATKSPL